MVSYRVHPLDRLFFVVLLCREYPPMQACIAVQSVFVGAVIDRPRETKGLPYYGVFNTLQTATAGGGRSPPLQWCQQDCAGIS